VTVPNPHDALFRAILGKAEHAIGELRAVLPAVVCEALDWPTLTDRNGSFVDDELKGQQADALFSVAWRGGGDALVYVLFEHQSQTDDRMAFRLLRYMVRIWEGWLKEHELAKTLPVILPIVLYHDDKRWSAPVSFGEMLDVPEALRAVLAPHLVQFSFLLDDLSAVSDEQLRERAMTALGRLAEVCFKHARTRPGLIDFLLDSWADAFIEVLRAPHGLDAIQQVTSYILRAGAHGRPGDFQRWHRFVGRVAGPDAEDAIMTLGEQLIKEGEERGIQKGRQEGRQEGVQQGERAFLLRQLRKRFGAQVDAAAEHRLEAASSEQLALWGERILSAGTLAELLAE
jgi:predicted transposase/invertase (TIGR01784 family)